jgi:pimeloyl-ACP methyl ester carboxylesterase
VNASALPGSCNGSTDTVSNPSASVTPINGYAIVGYIAPEDFETSGSPTDTITSRTIQVTTSGDPGNTAINMQVLRPPQFLIHGIWSDPQTWSYIVSATSQFQPFLGSWSSLSGAASGLSVSVPFVGGQLVDALNQFRSESKVAVAQVDLVGHSMGGLIGASIADSPNYLTADNYLQGPIHKLITVGTPYTGSPFATNLLAEYNAPDGCAIVKYVFPWFGKVIDAGAIQTLATSSPIVKTPAGIPMHAVVGAAGTAIEQSDQSTHFYGLLKTFCSYLNLQNGYQGLFNEDADLIVGVSSQGYGFSESTKEELAGAIHTLKDSFLFPVGQPELAYQGSGSSNQGVVSRLLTLFNSPVSSAAFYTVAPQQ